MDTHQDVLDAAREYIAEFGPEASGLDVQRIAGVRIFYELPEGSGACATAAEALRSAIRDNPYGRQRVNAKRADQPAPENWASHPTGPSR